MYYLEKYKLGRIECNFTTTSRNAYWDYFKSIYIDGFLEQEKKNIEKGETAFVDNDGDI